MARTKKSENIEATPEINQDDLLALIAQMKATMEEQAKQIKELKSEKTNKRVVESKTFSDTKKDIERRTVTITSLYSNTLILNGDHSHWLEPYKSESMSVKEAVKIVENLPQFLEQGFFTVDDWLIDEYGWAVNEHIMSLEDMRDFFKKSNEEALELFKNATPGQRTSIIDYIENRILEAGEFENINLAAEIGKIIGKDYVKLLSNNRLDDEDRKQLGIKG